MSEDIVFQTLNNGIKSLKYSVKIVDMGKLRAIVTLDLGIIKIKGFRVNFSDYKNEDGDELWVIPPSYQDSGHRYHPIFFCPDKELWKKITKEIIVEYKKASEEYHKKRFDLDDNNEKEINVADITF